MGETGKGGGGEGGRSLGPEVTVLDPESLLVKKGGTLVDTIGVPTYIRTFLVEREQLPATNRVRPWREGCESHVSQCISNAFLLPKYMNH